MDVLFRITSILIMSLGLWMSPLQADASSYKEQMQWLHDRFEVNFIYDSSLDLSLPYEGPSMMSIEQAETSDEKLLELCLETLFVNTGIEWEINNRYVVLTKGRKKPVDYIIFIENQTDTLAESRITAILGRDRMPSGTGLERIEGVKFRRSFSALSAPDVIKTLQVLPGVSGGTEMIGGLYVHGGTGNDNLFHLDGVPMFNVSHLAGLYSSFNADVIESLDFYKSGFPSMFGGRLSSVVDVNVRDGSMSDYKGFFTVGLINGAIGFEGPIVRNRTSFNIALRQSWLDILSIPGVAIYNRYKKDDGVNVDMGYGLTDLNAKLTHKFADGSFLRMNIYTGQDRLRFGMVSSHSDGAPWYADQEDYYLRWGNLLSSLSLEGIIGEGIRSDIKLYYSQYRSRMIWDLLDMKRYDKTDRFSSAIYDIGLKGDFSKTLSSVHELKYGFDNQTYIFAPELSWEYAYSSSEGKGYVNDGHEAQRYVGNEASVYVEDRMKINSWFSADVGLRAILFAVKGRTYARLEPRVSVCARPSQSAAFKFSYTEMNQFAHRLVTSYIDFPTSVWLPSTAGIAPMNSRQIALGADFILAKDLRLDTEIFYKRMNHIREYKGYTLFPPLNGWETMFVKGKGRAYGIEAGLTYNDGKTDASVYYTLSWSERFFRELYPLWYPDHFDNRHRLNLSVNHRFTKRFEMYGGWCWHTGNRMTVESQISVEGNTESLIYTSPNNVMMPDYHRMDIGFNFHRTTKRGNESIWNLSIYNLYCRMNPLTVDPPYLYDRNEEWEYDITGILPIIPSFSYTLRF